MQSQFAPDLRDRIARSGVIAVLVIDRIDDAVPLANALLEGGIDIMELTLRTPVAVDALKAIRKDVPGMLAGIGTILTTEQVHEVAESGAAFGVAPGTNPRIIREARKVGLPFAPGIATPSDLEVALELGCRDVKFFPAEPGGGLPYLKSLAAPYAHLGVSFVPLGGVTLTNMTDYLASPLMLAVGGSWLAPRDLIASKQWDEIRRRAEDARTAADKALAERAA